MIATLDSIRTDLDLLEGYIAKYYGPAGEYVIATSTDLETWTPVDIGDLTTNDSPGDLTYTLPTGVVGGKIFARLMVMEP